MRSRLLLVLFIFCESHARAALVRVIGVAPGYEGRKIAVIAVLDEISGRRNLLTSADVHDDSTFDLEFDINQTQRVYIHLQRIEAALYAEPGATYKCNFPVVGKNEFKRFDRTEVELDWQKPQQDELNVMIRKFNADYSMFIVDHFYDFASQEYRGSTQYLSSLGERKSKVDLFAKQSKNDSVPKLLGANFQGWVKQFDDSIGQVYVSELKHEYFAQYVKYATAELYLLSGMNRVEFYENYFMSMNLPMHNTAFVNCFKVYYQNTLAGRNTELQSKVLKAVNIDRSLEALCDAFEIDSTMQSLRIRRLACLNGLREVYYSKSFYGGSIDMLLHNVSTGDVLVDEIAADILNQLKRCAPGDEMPALMLTDETQEKWSVADYNGIPLYLYFFATWSPSSLKELLVLERWQEKFAGRMEFVAVAMDDDYRDFRKYLEEHPKQLLTFVYGNADPFIQEKINLKAIPHQLLIDEQARIITNAAPSPSDTRFESILNKVALKPGSQVQRPKTWKDH